MPSSRGKLIVLEGLDRAGKTSQCELLERKLTAQGETVNTIRFPDRSTPIGKMIDAYLKGEGQQDDHAIHLLFSANRWEAAAKIHADIETGTTVIIDRYYYSGCVYSAAKGDPSLGLAWARQADEGLPRPDVCIFLGISPEEAAKRGGWGGEKYETAAMQARVRDGFAQLQKMQPERQDLVRIDAGQAIEEVADDVWEAVQQVLRRVELHGRGLQTLEPWTPESIKAAGLGGTAQPRNNGAPAAPKVAQNGAAQSTQEKRSLKPQWGADYEAPATKATGINIQGDGMGSRKTNEKQWWEYGD